MVAELLVHELAVEPHEALELARFDGDDDDDDDDDSDSDSNGDGDDHGEDIELTSDLIYRVRKAVYRAIACELPAVAELAGAEAVRWDKIDGCFGKATGFDGYLRALVCAEPLARDHALGKILAEIEHQGSVYPATAAVVPYLIRLLDHPAADREALLDTLLDVATAAAESRQDAEDDDEDDDDAGDDGQDWRTAILGTLDAIGAGWPALARRLGDGSPEEQRRVLALAGVARGRPELRGDIERLAREAPEPAQRAIAIDALVAMRAPIDAVVPALSDPSLLVRLAAAIALAGRWGRKLSDQTGAAVDAVLADALTGDDGSALPAYGALPFVTSAPLAYLALAAGSRRTPACFALAAPLCAGLREVDPVSATALGRGLLALALGNGALAAMPGFVDVLAALAASSAFFAFSVNAAEVLEDFKLPTTRDGLTALAATLRAAQDPAVVLAEMLAPKKRAKAKTEAKAKKPAKIKTKKSAKTQTKTSAKAKKSAKTQAKTSAKAKTKKSARAKTRR